jgi:plastocyanin domain-containing protein
MQTGPRFTNHVLAVLAMLAFAAAGAASENQNNSSIQSAKVTVSDRGFQPAKIRLRAGTPARITFVRTTDKACGAEVMFPSLNIKRPLPVNEPIVIEFTPTKSEELAFTCGMDMWRGTVVVR